jgi:hypothetical protein
MANRSIDSRELRSLIMPEAKSGYDKNIVDTVITACADTIHDLENQIEELNKALHFLRAQSAPMEIVDETDDSTNDTILSWLNNLDPLNIDQAVQRNIAEAIVGSTMAASQIRHEATERIKILIDAVAIEVKKLIDIVRESKTSVALTSELPISLSKWEGEFSGQISTLLSQLELPWTVQIAQLAKVINHMSQNQITNKLRDDLEIRQSQHDPTKSITIKGQWE